MREPLEFFAAVVLLFAVFLLGGLLVAAVAEKGVAKKCDRESAFVADGYRYECKRIGRDEK